MSSAPASPSGQPHSRRSFLASLTAMLALPSFLRAGEPANAPDSVDALLDGILDEAVARKASDIHLSQARQGAESILRVRFQINGQMVNASRTVSQEQQAGLFAELAELLTMRERAEKQGMVYHDDGIQHFRTASGQRVWVRLWMANADTMPGKYAILRLVNDTPPRSLNGLGLGDRDLAVLQRVVKRKQGLILVAGATCSGKSTTLNALMHAGGTSDTAAIGLFDGMGKREDDEVSRAFADGGFSAGIRAAMHSAPAQIIVGETRDQETFESVVQAAETGHRVLTSVHAGCAADVPGRLLGMMPDDQQARHEAASLLARSVSVIVGQRMVSILCPDCSLPVVSGTGRTACAGGCRECAGVGFIGRRVMFEVLEATPEVREAIAGTNSREPLAATGLERTSDKWLDFVRAERHGGATEAMNNGELRRERLAALLIEQGGCSFETQANEWARAGIIESSGLNAAHSA